MSDKARKIFILIAVLIFIISLPLALAVEEKTIGLTLAEKVNNFYNWALAIGAIAALGIIVFGGILYITSTGNPGRLSEARAWITAALVGLLVLFGSFLILKTLNPKLTKLEDIVLPINPKAEIEVLPTLGNPQAVCDTLTECQQACSSFNCYPGGNCDTSSIEPWPGMLPFDQSVLLSSAGLPANITGGSGVRIWQGLIEPLRVASQVAQNRGLGTGLSYGIYMISGYRSLQVQFLLACADLSRVPTYVAWPGSSNHGQGNAVDVHPTINGVNSGATVTNCRTLAEIMYSAGWARYVREWWHFEYPAGQATSTRRTDVFDCAGG